jgi:hypothetical protein
MLNKSRIDNPETLSTLGTQATGRRQRKQKNTTQKTKMMSNTDPTKTGGEL